MIKAIECKRITFIVASEKEKFYLLYISDRKGYLVSKIKADQTNHRKFQECMILKAFCYSLAPLEARVKLWGFEANTI